MVKDTIVLHLKVATLITRGVRVTNHIDIIVESYSSNLKHIAKLDPSYLALWYPLLLLYDEDGYHDNIDFKSLNFVSSRKRKSKSMREFFEYMIQNRNNESLILFYFIFCHLRGYSNSF